MTRKRVSKAAKKEKAPKAKTPKAKPAQKLPELPSGDGEDVLQGALLKAVTRLNQQARCEEGDFRQIVDHLKNVCPGPKRCKIVVKRAPPEEMQQEYGYVTKERDQFEIVIDANMTYYETLLVLLHEWAHMLSWRPYHPLMGDHGPDWGVWHSRVWQKYHGVE